MANHKIDMTKGSIVKLTFMFALPLCIGAVLQNLYSVIDTVVVGNFCGAASIAAVGTSSQPVEILLCIFMGIGGGSSILISQASGKNDSNAIREVCRAAVFFLYAAAIPLTVIGMFAGPFILRLMQVPEDTMDLAVVYLRIVLAGTLGQMGFNMNSGILRGLGDSHSSLIFLLFSCALNIILDLVFVIVFCMNVFGVALATTIATFSSWILSVIYIKKHYGDIKFHVFPCGFNKTYLSQLVRIGLPLGLNSSLYSFGHTVMQSLINTQGSVFMAGCNIGTKLIGVSTIAVQSFSQAGLTFAGQNYGAGRFDRIKQGGVEIPFISGAFAFTGNMLMLIFCRQIVGIFTQDEKVIEDAIHYVRVVIPFSWCYSVFNGILNVVNGLGKVKYTTVVNLLMLWAVRIPCAYIIAAFFNGYYLMAAIPVSFAFGMISMLLFYITPYWREICKKAGNTSAVLVS